MNRRAILQGALGGVLGLTLPPFARHAFSQESLAIVPDTATAASHGLSGLVFQQQTMRTSVITEQKQRLSLPAPRRRMEMRLIAAVAIADCSAGRRIDIEIKAYHCRLAGIDFSPINQPDGCAGSVVNRESADASRSAQSARTYANKETEGLLPLLSESL